MSTAVAMFRRVFSFPGVLIAGLLFLTVWTSSERFDDPDLWWHLRIGETILSTHHIPTSDQFSFTARDHKWIAHEWLAEVSIALAYRLGGYVGLWLWMCAAACAIVVCSYLLCSWWSGNWKVALLGGILSLAFLTVSLAIRPLLVGHLFFVLELLILVAGLWKGSRWIWALPPLFVIWANCHGSFMFGLAALIGSFAWATCSISGRRITVNTTLVRKLAPLLLLCLAAPFVNPAGHGLVTYPINVMFSQPDNINSVEEWAPLDIHEPRAIVFGLVLAVIVAASIFRWAPVLAGEWVVVLGTAAMAVLHIRMLPLFGIAALPVACRILASHWDNYSADHDFPLLNAVLISVAGVSCYLSAPALNELETSVHQGEPVAAVQELGKLPRHSRLLNEYTWGGYLMWAAPDQPVFIDGRTDIYAWTGVMREYGRWALLQEDPQQLLERYSIDACLIRTTSPVARVMPYLPSWRRVYRDSLAEVYVRVKETVAAATFISGPVSASWRD